MYRLISTYIADLNSIRFLLGIDTSIPKSVCFNSIFDGISQLVYFNFTVTMSDSIFFGSSAVKAKPFNCFEFFFAYNDGDVFFFFSFV